MSGYQKRNLALFLYIYCCLFPPTLSVVNASAGGKYHVYIANGLPDNLRVNCWSNDEDLGDYNVPVNQRFRFTTTTELAKYFGTFWWGQKTNAFVVFSSQVASTYCGEADPNISRICYWLVTSDGFYIANVTRPPPEALTKVHPWAN
ncbi:OLC1v1021485C1 [Oldenlandia corymbosa var. corymbosa]|uniref:S-protein homolog n=1 Tax=Oldenlandia corymbosa var. corymbosa TaxID=529605 RepID=A0AAV1BY20_OLDCO|nr:OLC1v1021485C1 [Oldenlandia corymbosa var. corymbosa]